MTNPDLTDLILIVDRSGSMISTKDDAEGGINQLIKDQQQAPGRCALTLVDFDTEYRQLLEAVDIQDVPPYKLHPRGGTALLDAVGRTITFAKNRIGALPPPYRPGNVIVVIATDGQENASREFTYESVRAQVTECQAAGWEFVFLGANLDAFAEGQQLGICAANTVLAQDPTGSYRTTSAKITHYRSAVAGGNSGSMAWTPEEREAANGTGPA